MSQLENNIYSECYAKLANDRIIFLSEDITNKTASELSALLLYYDHQNNDDINIFINTNGGDVSALNNIYDIMKMIKSPIKTICIGKAYSAGTFILSAGTKGKRFITKNSTVMIHGLQCNFPGCYDNPNNSQIYFNFLKNLNKTILEILAMNIGKTYEEIDRICKNDKYMNAKEALAFGIVDEIV